MHGIKTGWVRIIIPEMVAKVFCCTRKSKASFLCVSLMLAIFTGAFAQTPIAVGYRDFSYGSTVFEAPTADKPESKLWWNDGSWWGILWNPSANKYRIHRFDRAAQSWINVGPEVDDRSQSLADALWDGQKLYIVSHVYSGGSQTSGGASAANSGRFYRYTYDAITKTYTLESGFPVTVNSAISEALVLDKDSTGKLWVTWTQSSKVYLNYSTNDGATWATPFALPTQGANTSSDDISTLLAFNGKIGVVWSNQSDSKIYFSLHHDSNAPTAWEPQEVALSAPGAAADDHVNIKMTNDGGGNLYVATKTSLSGSSTPGIYLHKRSFSGGWTNYVVATNADGYTRPIVVIDDENRELYIFAKAGSYIAKKKVSLDQINFPSGKGDDFIKSSDNSDINDATSSKHNVNGTTGILILASDEVNRYYYHNYLALTSNSGAAPTISSFAPTTGPVGTPVTITGNNFTGATAVAFNGTAAIFTVNSNTQITATVPTGATTGTISVTKATGVGTSANVFNVNAGTTQYTLTVNTAGGGSVALNPAGGVYDAGTMVTLTATPEAGYQFSGWSGAASGTTSQTTITMDANKTITATFTLIDLSGQVAHQQTVTGTSSSSITVKTSSNLTAMSGQLYLAAISMDAKVAVASVSGLGLNWTPVQAQCSGKNKTAIEIWMAKGAPTGSGAVTATFVSKPSNAVIAVSRYANVDAVAPIGNIVSGNTVGVNGACSGGVDGKTYSFNLNTVPQGGTLVYGAAALRDRSHTPGAGYTERADIRKSKAAVAVEEKVMTSAGAAILNGTFSGNVDWAVIGLEIRPQSSGAQYTLTTNVVGAGSVTPAGGSYSTGAMITLTAMPDAGYQFAGWSDGLSGAANPAALTMDANKNVIATFTQISATQHTLTVNTNGSGNVTLNPAGGMYDADTEVTLTATPDAGYRFVGWSGDLSATTTSAQITMNANKIITATFAVAGGSGQVVHEETVAGGSTELTTVATATSVTGINGHFYLAAISSSKPNPAVSSISGLGLSWSRLATQCSGRNNTIVEIWKGTGTPSGNGVVTATLAEEPSNAVIVVSRYSGVDAAFPIGNMITSNTMGVNGTCGSGSDNKTYSLSLTTTTSGAMIYGAAAMRNRTHTPGAGYAERIEILQGSSESSSSASLAIQEKHVADAGAAILNGTFSGSADWAVAGLELRPQLAMSKRRDEAAKENAPPEEFTLEANYPNPFNPSTAINFSLPVAANVRLNIYNVVGKLVRVLVAGEMVAGRYSELWNGRDNFNRDVAAGVYLYQIVMESVDGKILFTQTRRMTLLK
jgi:uncharacterized repeat protein (TIGR02543 family)